MVPGPAAPGQGVSGRPGAGAPGLRGRWRPPSAVRERGLGPDGRAGGRSPSPAPARPASCGRRTGWSRELPPGSTVRARRPARTPGPLLRARTPLPAFARRGPRPRAPQPPARRRRPSARRAPAAPGVPGRAASAQTMTARGLPARRARPRRPQSNLRPRSPPNSVPARRGSRPPPRGCRGPSVRPGQARLRRDGRGAPGVPAPPRGCAQTLAPRGSSRPPSAEPAAGAPLGPASLLPAPHPLDGL